MNVKGIKKESIEIEINIDDLLLALKQNILNLEGDKYELMKYFVSDNKIMKSELGSYNDIKYTEFSTDKNMVDKFKIFLKLEKLY